MSFLSTEVSLEMMGFKFYDIDGVCHPINFDDSSECSEAATPPGEEKNLIELLQIEDILKNRIKEERGDENKQLKELGNAKTKFENVSKLQKLQTVETIEIIDDESASTLELDAPLNSNINTTLPGTIDSLSVLEAVINNTQVANDLIARKNLTAAAQTTESSLLPETLLSLDVAASTSNIAQIGTPSVPCRIIHRTGSITSTVMSPVDPNVSTTCSSVVTDKTTKNIVTITTTGIPSASTSSTSTAVDSSADPIVASIAAFSSATTKASTVASTVDTKVVSKMVSTVASPAVSTAIAATAAATTKPSVEIRLPESLTIRAIPPTTAVGTPTTYAKSPPPLTPKKPTIEAATIVKTGTQVRPLAAVKRPEMLISKHVTLTPSSLYQPSTLVRSLSYDYKTIYNEVIKKREMYAKLPEIPKNETLTETTVSSLRCSFFYKESSALEEEAGKMASMRKLVERIMRKQHKDKYQAYLKTFEENSHIFIKFDKN